ncbi:MAG: acyl-CoA carboxylase subunit beta [Candidatus Tectomicrobia bacterium]|uniref:Acyl-CoA carboxylase subunit beta n=1 Tax=Tectimicrobiota bacterium TaxID=2528274 RepID=A0A933GLH3_UNCTE|nr:acyl-CoA carboxylase subunit beta [Candidatus Tectomicrobia bacterium]
MTTAENRAAMLKWLSEVETAKQVVSEEARSEAIAKQHALGKLSAMERINLLCDPGSYVEYGLLVKSLGETEDTKNLDAPRDGVIAGLGNIAGRPAAVVSWDFTVFGGSMGKAGGEKSVRMTRLAMQNGFPLIMLHDGGGHRIHEGLDSRHFARASGEGFLILARMSGWVPIVAGMMGPGFAGPSNFAAMADFTVMVKGTSTMGIAGPQLVKAALGEDLSKEELGGSRIHTAVTGMADLEAEDDRHCLKLIKEFLSFFPSNCNEPLPIIPCEDPPHRRDEELLEIIPPALKEFYDMRKVARHIVDHHYFFELKPRYAPNIITLLARMNGRPVGIVGNQPLVWGGTLDTPATEKAAHFISLCDAFGLPLIFLTDIPGFLPGSASEKTGLVRHSGKMLYEIGHATVPKISIVTRKGYGLGYLAMAGGRSFNADLAVCWPSANICAMSLEGAVDVAYRKDYMAAPDPQKRRQELLEHFSSQLGAVRAGEGFGLDDVIDPRDTRRLIISTLEKVKPRQETFFPPKRHGIVPI